MATVKAFIRVSSKKTEKAAVRFRLFDGRKVEISYRSSLQVAPDLWDPARQEIRPKALMDPTEKARINKQVGELKALIIDLYNNAPAGTETNSAWLKEAIEKAQHPELYQEEKETFFGAFHKFIEFRPTIGEIRRRGYRVIMRDLQRFELYQQRTRPAFRLELDTTTADTLHDFEMFLRKEHTFWSRDPKTGKVTYTEEYAPIIAAVPESRPPEERGNNTINGIFGRVRAFFRWAIETERTQNNPFIKFKIQPCSYGTPYYLTIEERNQLYNFDFSARPGLAVQRDIFVFHCLIGCRIGDLRSLKKENIIGGAVEYIASKTKEAHPVTIRVPLNQTAREILEKYKDLEGPQLLPFISEQKYRLAIKDMIRLAGIDRPVTILNPTTGKPETRPLYEIASSHLARRTFIGNLYKQVKDPNLIGSLSGHAEGSRAFARYRTIDEDMKQELVKLLD